jgi:hypothetical protein
MDALRCRRSRVQYPEFGAEPPAFWGALRPGRTGRRRPRGARPCYDKADKLQELLQRKPGQKHYKRSLMAFLDADAKAQKALLHQLQASAGSIVTPVEPR